MYWKWINTLNDKIELGHILEWNYIKSKNSITEYKYFTLVNIFQNFGDVGYLIVLFNKKKW